MNTTGRAPGFLTKSELQEFHTGTAAHAKHAAMGCICFENPGMGIYFIEDPDGYWIEIVPEK